jgi:hypothetical protein
VVYEAISENSFTKGKHMIAFESTHRDELAETQDRNWSSHLGSQEAERSHTENGGELAPMNLARGWRWC